MINIFIFYFLPQLTGGFWLSTLKEICLFSKTPPIPLLDTPPCCLDTERATTRDLIGQNMIVERYDPNDQSNHWCTFAPVMLTWRHIQQLCEVWFYKISGLTVTPWTLAIYNLQRKILNNIIYWRMYSWVCRLINNNDFHPETIWATEQCLSYDSYRIVGGPGLEWREK